MADGDNDVVYASTFHRKHFEAAPPDDRTTSGFPKRWEAVGSTRAFDARFAALAEEFRRLNIALEAK